MKRRWFWSLILVASLLLSIVGVLFLTVALVFWTSGPNTWISVSFGFDPVSFAVLGGLIAIAVIIFVLTARLR